MPTLDDYRWLTSAAALPALEAASDAMDELAAITKLRHTLSQDQAALAVEQAVLRRVGRAKFRHAERMFFARRALEQATDEVTARYKASRFPQGEKLADLCCGIGGDLRELGFIAQSAVGYDRDPALAILASANCRAASETAGRPCNAWAVASEAAREQAANVAAWHIDPDRRVGGRRLTRFEALAPGPELIEQLLAANGNAAIKLAPATEPPLAWRESSEWEWIGRGGECKQLVCWFGSLARHAGRRCATVLAADGTSRTVIGRGDSSTARVPAADDVGRYVFEPDAAVLAASLEHDLAAECDLRPLHPESVYLTGDAALRDGALAAFEVVETMPLDVRNLRAYLAKHDIGTLEIKKRGVEIEPEKLRRELKPAGKHAACLILARRGDRVTALVARRVNSTRQVNAE